MSNFLLQLSTYKFLDEDTYALIQINYEKGNLSEELQSNILAKCEIMKNRIIQENTAILSTIQEISTQSVHILEVAQKETFHALEKLDTKENNVDTLLQSL